MRDFFKKFLSRIWDKIQEQLATWVVTLLVTALAIVGLFFKKWLFSKHYLELYGVFWIVIFSIVAILPILILWYLTKSKVLYENENDIKNILELWFSSFSHGRSSLKNKLTIKFSLCDKINHVVNGSSKKYLEGIANKLGYSTFRRGNDTIVFMFTEGNPKARGSNFLDDLPELF